MKTTTRRAEHLKFFINDTSDICINMYVVCRFDIKNMLQPRRLHNGKNATDNFNFTFRNLHEINKTSVIISFVHRKHTAREGGCTHTKTQKIRPSDKWTTRYCFYIGLL